MDQADIKSYFDANNLSEKNIRPAHLSYLISLIAAKWYTYDEVIETGKLSPELPREDSDEKFLLGDILTDMTKLNLVILNGPKSLRKESLEMLYEREEQIKHLNLSEDQFYDSFTEWIYAMTYFSSRITAPVRKKFNCKDKTTEFDPEKYGNDPELLEAYLLLKSVNVVDAMAQRAGKTYQQDMSDVLTMQKTQSQGRSK